MSNGTRQTSTYRLVIHHTSRPSKLAPFYVPVVMGRMIIPATLLPGTREPTLTRRTCCRVVLSRVFRHLRSNVVQGNIASCDPCVQVALSSLGTGITPRWKCSIHYTVTST